ncbi:MAG: hypothetical protein ACYSUM_24580, partial [Planctomycetota bacterium]
MIAVDVLTGDRTLLSSATGGTGPTLTSVRALAFDGAGSLCLVWDAGRGAVIAVDVLTGDRTLLSSATGGTGPTLTSVRALAFDGA